MRPATAPPTTASGQVSAAAQARRHASSGGGVQVRPAPATRRHRPRARCRSTWCRVQPSARACRRVNRPPWCAATEGQVTAPLVDRRVGRWAGSAAVGTAAVGTAGVGTASPFRRRPGVPRPNPGPVDNAGPSDACGRDVAPGAKPKISSRSASARKNSGQKPISMRSGGWRGGEVGQVRQMRLVGRVCREAGLAAYHPWCGLVTMPAARCSISMVAARTTRSAACAPAASAQSASSRRSGLRNVATERQWFT